ncbi:hypothetical protein EAE96_010202 [Botrytis aclada]|nr:hypothetical protein EAE96_010202 [Botrytis aclada]
MDNPDISSSSASIMTPSASDSSSTVQVSPLHGHPSHAMLLPESTSQGKKRILRADSGIAIPPDTNAAIPDTDKINSQSNAPLKEIPIDTISTDTPGATPTVNMNVITNLVPSLDRLNTHLKAILTPVPDTPKAKIDASSSISEISLLASDEEFRNILAGKEEEDPLDASIGISEATVAGEMRGTMSELDQILKQIRALPPFPSHMPRSFEQEEDEEEESDEEETSIRPTISVALPPSTPSEEHTHRRARITQWTFELPAPLITSFTGDRPLFNSPCLWSKIRHIMESKEEYPYTTTFKYWTPKDADAFIYHWYCENGEYPFDVRAGGKHPSHLLPSPEKEKAQPEAQPATETHRPTLSEPDTSQPILSAPDTSAPLLKPWACRHPKTHPLNNSPPAGPSREEKEKEGESKGEEKRKVIVLRMTGHDNEPYLVVVDPTSCMECVKEKVREKMGMPTEEEEKEKEKKKKKNQKKNRNRRNKKKMEKCEKEPEAELEVEI